MPRNISAKPKSKQKGKSTDNIQRFLGEDSIQEESVSENETFQSAELDGQTDYGLDFTSSRTRRNENSRPANVDNPKELGSQNIAPSASRNNFGHSASSSKKKRKQSNPKQREARFWKTVKNLQSKTDNLVPKANFSRVIREIMIQQSTTVDRLTYTALSALQEATEIYLTTLFQDAYCCTLHRGRVTLNVRDIELARFLRGPLDPGNR